MQPRGWILRWEATSGSPVELDSEFTVNYDQDQGNTIRKVVGELTYPKIDADCTDITPGEGNNCRAKLDLHAFNEEDEEATNTSNTGVNRVKMVIATAMAVTFT